MTATGTAPVDASSGDHVRHRLSRGGNRQINSWSHVVLHIMATVQLRHPGCSPGRDYYDRKRAAGKSSGEAMRCVKRRLSDVVYKTMIDDLVRGAGTGPGGHSGTATKSSVAGSHPVADSSDKSLPGPVTTQLRTAV